MLELLGEELLGCVLQQLAPADLSAARQASKLLDIASRNQLDAAATLHLTPDNTANGFPRFGRFLRLRCIVFVNWDVSADLVAQLEGLGMCVPSVGESHDLCLRITSAFMDTQPEHLAGVTEVAVQHSTQTLSLALPLLLGMRLCNVTCLRIGGERVNPGWAQPIELNMLAAVLMSAPKLKHLLVPFDYFTDHAADILSKTAPCLKSLKVTYEHDDPISKKGMHMVADRMGQLTSLVFLWGYCGDACVPLDTAVTVGRLQQLHVLRGIKLPFDCVEMLAAGLPQLRVLEIAPDGDWGLTSAVFRSVSYLKLTNGGSAGFCRARALGSVFPSLQHLIVLFDLVGDTHDVVEHHVPLAGLTGLLSLQLKIEDQAWPLAPDQWDAIAAMSNLQQLKCNVNAAEAAELRRLYLRGLRALDVRFVRYHAEGAPVFNSGTTLVQIGCSFPGLQALEVWLPCDEKGPAPMPDAMLSQFMQSLPLLERLTLCYRDVTYDQVCVLAMHSRLRVLRLTGIHHPSNELQQLAIQHAKRGVTIRFFEWGHNERDEVFDGSPPVRCSS